MKKLVSVFGDQNELYNKLNARAKEYALTKNIDFVWVPQDPFSEESVIEAFKDADAGVIDVQHYGEEIFSQIKDKTKLLVRFGVGFDAVDLKAATANHIAIARTTGGNLTAVAEMALTMILSARRRYNLYQKRVHEGDWVKDVGHELIGATVGILGFGNIGKRLARLLSGFDCKVLVYDPFPNMAAIEAAGATLTTVDEIFKQCDAISIHVPLTSETKNMVNERTLGLMKPSAVVVNTARGGLVDEEALYNALKDHKIAGAGLDVFAQEPLSLDSPLLTLDNCILTPHVSSQTEESLWNIYKMSIDISADFFEGKESPHILNKDYNK